VRAAEKRARTERGQMTLIALVCFSALGLAAFYTNLKILSMEQTITAEKRKLALIEAEYRNYQEMHVSIDKADIELLNQLQMNRIYWTKKLEAIARHLPDEQPISYWITKFGYKSASNTFNVHGYGYITQKQEQLLALDNYLNDLRSDPSYTDILSTTYLNSAVRSDEEDNDRGVTRERVSFEYSSLRKGASRR
jgi:Tfp pilus assembly protein PilN